MPNELPVPQELQHLIEKRENGERRQRERRGGVDSGSDDSAQYPAGRGAPGADEAGECHEHERRSGMESRKARRRTANGAPPQDMADH